MKNALPDRGRPATRGLAGIAERGADERRAKSRSAGAAPARRCVPTKTARGGRRGAGRPARRAGPRGARARAARRVGARFPGFADFGFISDLNWRRGDERHVTVTRTAGAHPRADRGDTPTGAGRAAHCDANSRDGRTRRRRARAHGHGPAGSAQCIRTANVPPPAPRLALCWSLWSRSHLTSL